MMPALVTDLILQRTMRWRVLVRGLAIGVVFLAVFIAVQWPFANFLMSPLARNWVFGTTYMDFSTPPTSMYASSRFMPTEPGRLFWQVMGIALAITCTASYIGLHVGRVMQRIRR
jgi:hypothetical protein